MLKSKKNVSECYQDEPVSKVITLDDIIDSSHENTTKQDILEKIHPVPEKSVLAGMKEITYQPTEENKIKFIENPLPVPKRKEHKAMDYDITNIGDSDFDIQDMTGMDYFDIE